MTVRPKRSLLAASTSAATRGIALRENADMPIGRAERRSERSERVGLAFGRHAASALDLLELLDFAWHDCFAEMSPPAAVIDDLLVVSDGSIEDLARFSLLAVIDWRDLRVAADARRHAGEEPVA